MLSWDLEKERNVKVWADTLSTRLKKRGDRLKSWLMLQDYTALNAMFRKTHQKQTTFISPKDKENKSTFYSQKEDT